MCPKVTYTSILLDKASRSGNLHKKANHHIWLLFTSAPKKMPKEGSPLLYHVYFFSVGIMPPPMPLNEMTSHQTNLKTLLEHFFTLYTMSMMPTTQKIVVIFALLALGIWLAWEPSRGNFRSGNLHFPPFSVGGRRMGRWDIFCTVEEGGF